MYHFSKRIKCADCGKNYKGLKERKDRIVYICSGYSNYGKEFCSERWKIDQDFLMYLIQNHYEIELLKSGVGGGNSRKPIEKYIIASEILLERVDEISVSPTQQVLVIKFRNGTTTVVEPRHYAYWQE